MSHNIHKQRHIDYFDKVHIFFWGRFPDEVQKTLPMSVIEGYAHSAYLRTCYKTFKNKSRRFLGTVLCIQQPNDTLLLFLANHEDSLGRYSISRIEIARDLRCKSRQKALKLSDRIMNSIARKYVSHYHYFEDIKQKKQKEGIFSRHTTYLGSRSNKTVVAGYARYSKPIGDSPAAHTEIRLRRKKNICKMTGISTLADLVNFDFTKFLRWYFENWCTFLKIDHHAHGTFLIKSISRSELRQHRKNDRISAESISIEICKLQKLYCAQALLHYYKQRKGALAKQIGRPSEIDIAVRDFSLQTLRSFTRPVTMPKCIKKLLGYE